MDLLSLEFHRIVGCIGVSLILLAYYLNSHKRLDRGRTYQYMNIAGAVLYGIDLFVRETWEGVSLEIVWISIGLSALHKRRKERRSK